MSVISVSRTVLCLSSVVVIKGSRVSVIRVSTAVGYLSPGYPGHL